MLTLHSEHTYNSRLALGNSLRSNDVDTVILLVLFFRRESLLFIPFFPYNTYLLNSSNIENISFSQDFVRELLRLGLLDSLRSDFIVDIIGHLKDVRSNVVQLDLHNES